MDKLSKNNRDNNTMSRSPKAEDYVKQLSNEHKMLVILKAQLYSGSWQTMKDDLSNRLQGKPYIFKLVNRINDDIGRIDQMRTFEEENGVDLVDYTDLT